MLDVLFPLYNFWVCSALGFLSLSSLIIIVKCNWIHRILQITFKVTGSSSGSIKVCFDLDQFDAAETSFKEKLGSLTRNEKEFCATFRKNAYPASAATSDAPLPPAYSSQATSHKPQATKRRVSAGVPVASTAELELASPNKKKQIMANHIDQKIDSRYIGKWKQLLITAIKVTKKIIKLHRENYVNA